LHKVEHNFKWGVKFLVNNGESTLFWEDVWISKVPLKLLFPTVYSYCRVKNVTVNQSFVEGELSFDFRRTFSLEDIQEWEDLNQLVQDVPLNRDPDQVIWVLEKSKTYTIKSMYRFLTFRGVINKRFQQLWRSKLPMKLKVFMWLALQNRLQTGTALEEKKWKGDQRCGLCRVDEDVDHILFRCVMAQFTWSCLREALG